MVVLGTGSTLFKLSKIQTFPVISPSAWEPAEAQAASENKAAIPATISIVFFIVYYPFKLTEMILNRIIDRLNKQRPLL
jgi:hypothetical protein